MSPDFLPKLLFAAIVLVNAYASFSVLRTDYFTSAQKSFQLLLIWFVPFIGGILSLSFVTAHASTTTSDGAPIHPYIPPDHYACGAAELDAGGDSGSSSCGGDGGGGGD